MYVMADNGTEYDAPTLCDIYDCEDCPRLGDDCDGNDEYFARLDQRELEELKQKGES